MSLVFLSAALAGCSSPDKVLDKVDSGEYVEAFEVYEKVLADGDIDDEKGFQKEFLESVQKNMKENIENKDFERALLQIDQLEDFSFISDYLNQSKATVENAKQSEEAFQTGMALYKESNLDDALTNFHSVREDDKSNFKKAQNLIDEIMFTKGKGYYEEAKKQDSLETYKFAYNILSEVSEQNKSIYQKTQKLLNKSRFKLGQEDTIYLMEIPESSEVFKKAQEAMSNEAYKLLILEDPDSIKEAYNLLPAKFRKDHKGDLHKLLRYSQLNYYVDDMPATPFGTKMLFYHMNYGTMDATFNKKDDEGEKAINLDVRGFYVDTRKMDIEAENKTKKNDWLPMISFQTGSDYFYPGKITFHVEDKDVIIPFKQEGLGGHEVLSKVGDFMMPNYTNYRRYDARNLLDELEMLGYTKSPIDLTIEDSESDDTLQFEDVFDDEQKMHFRDFVDHYNIVQHWYPEESDAFYKTLKDELYTRNFSWELES